jgi:hypothetical protein
MGADSDDPRRIEVLAVTAEDVVAALEARQQRGRPVVLRATPPFSGRMRARLHVPTNDEGADPGPEDGPAPLHVEPSTFVADDAPDYPRPADTEDELRADPDREYTVDRHHEYHQAAIDDWRAAVCEHFVDETTITTARGDRRVDVVVLG